MNLERHERWEDKFLEGDHSDDDWFLSQVQRDVRIHGMPLWFSAASTIEAFSFLRDKGIDLTEQDDTRSTVLMEPEKPFDIEVFRWLADEFSRKDAIDIAEEEGFTALSTKIKFGELEKARILLEKGASVTTFATVARYGGAKITIAHQAINCIPKGSYSQEDTALEALKLLVEFGYSPDRDHSGHLLDAVPETKPRLRTWIDNNLVKRS